MDRIELTRAQERIIIEFIKRWGVDSPELVAEMLDHYCELVMEEMEKGREFQEVVNSWKTKQTYFKLRKIEESFSNRLKKAWQIELKNSIKNVLLGKPIFILIPLYFLFVLAFTNEFSSNLLAWAFSIRFFIAALIFLGFSFFNKKKRRIYGFKQLISFGMFNLIVLIQIVPDLLTKKSWLKYINGDMMYVHAGVFTLVIAADLVCYQLYTRANMSASLLTDEILTEFEVPSRT